MVCLIVYLKSWKRNLPIYLQIPLIVCFCNATETYPACKSDSRSVSINTYPGGSFNVSLLEVGQRNGLVNIQSTFNKAANISFISGLLKYLPFHTPIPRMISGFIAVPELGPQCCKHSACSCFCTFVCGW